MYKKMEKFQIENLVCGEKGKSCIKRLFKVIGEI